MRRLSGLPADEPGPARPRLPEGGDVRRRRGLRSRDRGRPGDLREAAPVRRRDAPRLRQRRAGAARRRAHGSHCPGARSRGRAPGLVPRPSRLRPARLGPSSPTRTPLGLRFAVTGASGFVGRHLVRQAAALGYEAVGIVRNPAGAEAVKADGGRAVVVPALLADDLVPALAGCRAVVHLAQIGAERDGLTYEAVNIGGTAAVVAAARAAGVSRVVLFSGLGVASFGRKPRCTTRYFLSKLEAELAALPVRAGGRGVPPVLHRRPGRRLRSRPAAGSPGGGGRAGGRRVVSPAAHRRVAMPPSWCWRRWPGRPFGPSGPASSPPSSTISWDPRPSPIRPSSSGWPRWRASTAGRPSCECARSRWPSRTRRRGRGAGAGWVPTSSTACSATR